MIKIAKTTDEFLKCYPIMHELRDQISAKDYMNMISEMRQEGYQLAFMEEGDEIVSCAGFRINTTLFKGKFMYVDDLVTGAKFRSMQYGEKMINWLKVKAIESGCKNLSLHSGVQRNSAHKFYLNQGFILIPHHFNMPL